MTIESQRRWLDNMIRRIAVILTLALCAIGIRIAYVNHNALSIEKEHYQTGEWVELDGNFLHSKSEDTQGYSIRVLSAEKLSYNDYIDRYGIDQEKKSISYDAKSLIALEIEFKNEGNENGSILIFECKLVPARKNEYFIRDNELWAESEPKMKDNLRLQLVKDSSYLTVIPYKINLIDEENLSQYRNPIEDSSFELVVSNAPIKKVIDIDLEPSSIG